ncbi:MAG: hypothetical protein ACI8Y7_000526 [Candidatus Woesearchaeota archaeon]|jgi:hypothetical protein
MRKVYKNRCATYSMQEIEYIVRLVKKQIKTILTVTILCFILGIFLILLIPLSQTASAVVELGLINGESVTEPQDAKELVFHDHIIDLASTTFNITSNDVRNSITSTILSEEVDRKNLLVTQFIVIEVSHETYALEMNRLVVDAYRDELFARYAQTLTAQSVALSKQINVLNESIQLVGIQDLLDSTIHTEFAISVYTQHMILQNSRPPEVVSTPYMTYSLWKTKLGFLLVLVISFFLSLLVAFARELK